MKNISKIKKKSIIALAMALTLVFSSIVSVSATETATAVASSSSSESKANDEDREDSEDKEKDKESDTEESTEESTEKDYTFSTTTKGNSELVANQEVLLENGYHQFIAVETRDGDIFYIIIDKTKTEDNVYFLNEVDTYDINKLMSDDDSSGSSNNTTASSVENKATEATEAPTATKQNANSSSGNSQFMLILVVGICLLGGIGFAIFKLSKGKKKPVVEDDFFDEDDDEINEDKEGTV